MRTAECMYICLVIVIVHCDGSTTSYKMKRTPADPSSNSSTIDDGTTDEEMGDKPRVSEIGNNENSNNGGESTWFDGKQRQTTIKDQIDVPFKNENQFSNRSHYVLLGQRRGYLIINQRMSRQNFDKKRRVAKAQSLLYEEYNEDGSKIYSYAMSSLDDVAKFFEYYLNTHICHGSCPLLPTTRSTEPPELLAEK